MNGLSPQQVALAAMFVCFALWSIGTVWSWRAGRRRFALLAVMVGCTWIFAYQVPADLARRNHVYEGQQIYDRICRPDSCLGPEWTLSVHTPEAREAKHLRDVCCGSRTSSFRGFEDSPQQFLYPWILLTLGALLLALKYTNSPWRPDHGAAELELSRIYPGLFQALPVACVIFASMRWTHYQRLLSKSSSERWIYSYVNHDIALGSALYNDFLFLVFCVLLAAICLDARHLASRTRGRPLDSDPTIEQVKRAYEDVVASYSYWKLASLGLALAFLYLSYVYWDIIGAMGDRRYWTSAMLTHLLWALSWLIVSSPLVAAWRRWKALRARSAFIPASDRKFSFEELHPIDTWGFVGITAAGFVSFLIPPMQKVIEVAFEALVKTQS